MADGDYYISYADARASIGNPSTTSLTDAQLEVCLKLSFGRIHSFISLAIKATNAFFVLGLAFLQSKYLKYQYNAMRLGKETGNIIDIDLSDYELTEDDWTMLKNIEENSVRS